MRNLILKTGQTITVDDDIYELIAVQTWAADVHGTVYRSYRVDGRPVRDTLNNIVAGRPPEGCVWIHRDGEWGNFTRANLEAITLAERARRVSATRRAPSPRIERTTSTQRRTAKREPGEYVGIACEGNKWRAHITIAGKLKRLGAWYDKETAARAYDDAVAALGKPRVNFPTAEDLAADAREQAEIDALPRPHSRAMRELREKKRAETAGSAES